MGQFDENGTHHVPRKVGGKKKKFNEDKRESRQQRIGFKQQIRELEEEQYDIEMDEYYDRY